MTGAGRNKKEDAVDHSAGILLYKKTGDYVKEGEAVAELLYNSSASADEAAALMKDSYLISDEKAERTELIKEMLA
jgi:thymidine phosphorylase